MTSTEYIELNIDLIDNDLVYFFRATFYDGVVDKSLNEMIQLMESAGINTLDARKEALHQVLISMFKHYEYSAHLPLDEWIETQMVNHMGFSIKEIFDHMIKNKNCFVAEYVCVKYSDEHKCWMVAWK